MQNGWWRQARDTTPSAPVGGTMMMSDAGSGVSFVNVMLRSPVPGVKARIEGSDDVLQLPASIRNVRGKTTRATFFRDGFEPQTMDIVFDEERAVQVTLPALPSPDAAPALERPTVQAPVEPAPRPATSRRKRDKQPTEKVDEDIYRRPGMGDSGKH